MLEMWSLKLFDPNNSVPQSPRLPRKSQQDFSGISGQKLWKVCFIYWYFSESRDEFLLEFPAPSSPAPGLVPKSCQCNPSTAAPSTLSSPFSQWRPSSPSSPASCWGLQVPGTLAAWQSGSLAKLGRAVLGLVLPGFSYHYLSAIIPFSPLRLTRSVISLFPARILYF